MNAKPDNIIMMVSLPETMVGRLMALRAYPGEPISSVINRVLEPTTTPRSIETGTGNIKRQAPSGRDRYYCEILGAIVRAPTLPRLFGAVVDLVHEIDPSIVEKLSRVRARRRRYVARERDAIHPARPDLGATRTASGWWVSSNVGVEDVERALRVLSQVAGLKWGGDIKFYCLGT